VGAIEAAYRSLVKRHHPDVAASADDQRMKRLNLARDWLTDPIRRRR
jgi:curved DNA-binding protein CbpA